MGDARLALQDEMDVTVFTCSSIFYVISANSYFRGPRYPFEGQHRLGGFSVGLFDVGFQNFGGFCVSSQPSSDHGILRNTKACIAKLIVSNPAPKSATVFNRISFPPC